MIVRRKDNTIIWVTLLLVTVSLIWWCNVFPLPRGHRINKSEYTYYKNIFGIYYISVSNPLELISYGEWGYLSDTHTDSFEVLDDKWAKDRNHVWYKSQLVKNASSASFKVNKSGIASDSRHVFVERPNGFSVRTAMCDIDPSSAEYFVDEPWSRDGKWMRDSKSVYLDETKLDVDRNSFEKLGGDWFADKNYVYRVSYSQSIGKWEISQIDTLRTPVQYISDYLRNGSDILYRDKVIIKDVDVTQFQKTDDGKIMINGKEYRRGMPL